MSETLPDFPAQFQQLTPGEKKHITRVYVARLRRFGDPARIYGKGDTPLSSMYALAGMYWLAYVSVLGLPGAVLVSLSGALLIPGLILLAAAALFFCRAVFRIVQSVNSRFGGRSLPRS
jgi:hypothetical protein